MAAASSIAVYLLQRLQEAGVAHMFGVPGDYVLRFYDALIRSDIEHVGTTREDTAAFAADGYARARGMGAVAVTYGVGALNVVNAVAGAHAESSPVVVISGAPGVQEQRDDPMLHHRFGPFTFQREIFSRITCATAVLDDRLTAFREIDRTLAAAKHHSSPVYIELPRDMVDAQGYPVPVESLAAPDSDPDALAEAVEETMQLLSRARRPVILAGVEVHRRGLQPRLVELVLRGHVPVAATLTGKSVVGERHPAYLGVYEGGMGDESVRAQVEDADLLLMLGVTLNDVDTGINTARLEPARIIRVSRNEAVVRHHRYTRVALADFLAAVTARIPSRTEDWSLQPPPVPPEGFPQAGRPMSVARLVQRLNQALTAEIMVVADTGDCLWAGMDLRVHQSAEFLASAFYTTMGFAVPAALGAQIAQPGQRALVLVGDGAFQMTGTELATAARLGLAPIVIVFNNRGYSTERYILDGPFNDIGEWRFHRLGELFGPLAGFDVPTEDAFEHALTEALRITDRPSILNVHLATDDASPAMRRLAQHLAQRV